MKSQASRFKKAKAKKRKRRNVDFEVSREFLKQLQLENAMIQEAFRLEKRRRKLDYLA